jgi:hypothetical protein
MHRALYRQDCGTDCLVHQCSLTSKPCIDLPRGALREATRRLFTEEYLALRSLTLRCHKRSDFV